jgi:hypothetical protein
LNAGNAVNTKFSRDLVPSQAVRVLPPSVFRIMTELAKPFHVPQARFILLFAPHRSLTKPAAFRQPRLILW